MQQLYDTLRGHFEELQEILNGGDVNQFEVYEAQSFCTTIAQGVCCGCVQKYTVSRED